MEANESVSVHYERFGSVEGVLKSIPITSTTLGNYLIFIVCDLLTNKGVVCHFSSDLFDEAKNAVDQRVSVSGLIRSTEDGEKISIEIEEIEVFPPEDRLPGIKDFIGLLKLAFS